MLRAALRRAVTAALLSAAVMVARSSPLPSTRLSGGEYVSVIDVASRLGLRLSWNAHGHTVSLTGHNHRVDLTSDNHEAVVDGIRLYLGSNVLDRGGIFFLSRIDFERRLGPLINPALAGVLPRKPLVIALDPGHGGSDSGTQNVRLGLKEKMLTLDVAFRLKKILETAGYRVVLTRTSDSYVDLPVRPEIANQAGADLFISIHFNAVAADSRVRGSEVFTFVPEDQRSSDSWGHNKDDRMTLSVPSNRFDGWNAVFAHAMVREIQSTLRTDILGEKIAHFAVIRPLGCPGILVEPACLSNDAEAQRVGTAAFRQQIAEALAAGVRDYAALLDSLRPVPVRAADHPK